MTFQPHLVPIDPVMTTLYFVIPRKKSQCNVSGYFLLKKAVRTRWKNYFSLVLVSYISLSLNLSLALAKSLTLPLSLCLTLSISLSPSLSLTHTHTYTQISSAKGFKLRSVLMKKPPIITTNIKFAYFKEKETTWRIS